MTLKASAEYFVKSERLKVWIEKNIDFLNALDEVEIEQLVFALKNASHDLPQRQGIESFIAFNEKLKVCNSSDEQLAIHKRAFKKLLNLIIVAALMGVALCLSIGLLISFSWEGGLLLLAVALYLFYKAIKLDEAVEILKKEQDRRYLLSSIRSAKTAEELTWAGLFAYNSKSNSFSTKPIDHDIDAEEIEVIRLRQDLRNCLYRDFAGPYIGTQFKPGKTL
jgi:hypothetical protein